jgi:hypothetical protein
LLAKRQERRFITALLASVAVLFLTCRCARADDFPSGTYKLNTNPIPWGGGCKPVSMKDGTLTASCLNFFQVEQHTVLTQADTCVADHHDIKNVNGILRCVSSETPVNSEHPYVADVISVAADVKTAEGETRTIVIDQPRVDAALTPLPSISFKPGDTVTIGAGGCVQTGGFGSTWKSYTAPLGSDADKFYSGTLWIDGVTGGGPQKIAAVMHKTWKVPVPKDPKLAKQYFLQLGYSDDGLADNGYWSHDDGNDDQCKNIGPAWVEIKITSGAVVSGVQLSPHSKPFDVVWDMNNEDFNGLPLNPQWTSQLTNPGVPDFKASCGAAFPQQTVLGVSWGGTSVNIDTLASQCTSQAPVADLKITDLIDVGYCRGLADGHLLWDIATYTGPVNYQDWSGDKSIDNFWLADGDYGMGIFSQKQAGQTTTEPSLGLEFTDDETLRLAGAAWWKQLVNGIENGGTPTPASMMGGAGGIPGVVTAVISIDGVHDHGYAELHPVFALALNKGETDVTDGVQQTWVFFLRNSGNNGGCSREISTWPSSLGNNEYFIQLQWPEGATGAKVVGPSEFFSWQDQKTIGSIKTSADPGWTLIDVKFPPDGEFGVDGQFTVEYSFPPGSKKHAAPRAAMPISARVNEKEADSITLAEVVSKIKDPTLVAQFRTEAQALKYASPAPSPKRIPMTFDTSMAVLRKSPGKASAGRLTRPVLRADPVQQNLDARQKELLDKYVSQVKK